MKKVMKNRKVMLTIAVLVLAVSLFGSGGVIANPPAGSGDPPVASKINYQGQLTDSAGNPLDGAYNMEFRLYDSVSGGSKVGSTIYKDGVNVTNGLFSVQLNVNQADFNGQGLWLEVTVEGYTLSPRQEMLPVPYALSLKPGAYISGTIDQQPILYVRNYGSGDGAAGLEGGSEKAWGVWGNTVHGVGVGGTAWGNGIGVDAYSLSGAAIYAEGTGRIESTADSCIFISGNEFIKKSSSDSTRWDGFTNGAVRIWRGGAPAGQTIHVPITVPGVLYGQNVTVKELTIYYECQDGTKNYIAGTEFFKQTDVDSLAVIASDYTQRTSNTATSYTLSLTQNNVLSSDQGILGLTLYLDFVDDTNYILFGGVRLRLGHSSD